jgi:hypothetical protein
MFENFEGMDVGVGAILILILSLLVMYEAYCQMLQLNS